MSHFLFALCGCYLRGYRGKTVDLITVKSRFIQKTQFLREESYKMRMFIVIINEILIRMIIILIELTY